MYLPAARRFLGIAVLGFCFVQFSPHATTRAEELPPVKKANFKLANKWNSDFVKTLVFEARINPRFIGKTDEFWYTIQNQEGTLIYRVNPKDALKKPLLDRSKLAAQLSEASQKPLDEKMLNYSTITTAPTGFGGGGQLGQTTRQAQNAGAATLRGFRVTDDGKKARFIFESAIYEYDLGTDKLNKLGDAPKSMPPTFPGQEASQEQLQQWQQEFQRWRQEMDDFMKKFEDKEEKKEEKKDDQEEKKDDEKNETRPRPKGGNFGDYRVMSPDKKHYLYAQKHNLYLAAVGDEKNSVQLSTDGKEDYSFGGNETDRKSRANATWSKDSRFFYASRSDSRGVKELFLVNSLTDPRPSLEKYKYAMPGEENIQKPELFYGDVKDKKLKRVTPRWKDEWYQDVHFPEKKPGELRFQRRDRLRRHLEFCSLNLNTGESKCVFEEGFDAGLLDPNPMRYLDDSDEMIWWSEKSGWGHFYLLTQDGKPKNAITSGSWKATRIAEIDTKKRQAYVEGNGRESYGTVYERHLYRVNLDGSNIVDLTPGPGLHTTFLSPSKEYVIDICESVSEAPTVCLRDSTGKATLILEKTDTTRLEQAGWQKPTMFTVKAADGVTELYGNMWKPFDFDPKKKYPIIAHVYPGPQMEGTDRAFRSFSTNMQLAQLGFIVIQVGHRGGTPERSKAYHDFGYYNLRDYALADKKYAIEQLAALYAWIDIERVGIYGHSGGGFLSAAALLQKPYNDFFKAAVASAGNHDNNIYNNSWSERYHGLKEVPNRELLPPPKELIRPKKSFSKEGVPAELLDEYQQILDDLPQEKKQEMKMDTVQVPDVKFEIRIPTNAELAANLKGALLLVHGDMDNNVHPANTTRLVDALIKARKRFDMLTLPGKRHGFADYQPYFTQKMWDFFADHLLGDRPTGAEMWEKVPERK
jgi:dipeptidyl aminopeptidase/acylaminoacyl peptidase